MHVHTDRPATIKGSPDWFTGDVYVDPIRGADDSSRLLVSHVHFSPGARTAWHTHPHGQTLYVTDGVGFVGRRDGTVHEIRPGDVVQIDPDEEHWHGATATNFMAHIAMNETDDNGVPATWGEHVTDHEYGNAR
jgi:quercetin dioxygenase-like cupin family protein